MAISALLRFDCVCSLLFPFVFDIRELYLYLKIGNGKQLAMGDLCFICFKIFTGYQITSKFKNKIMVSVMDSLGKDSIIVER